MRVVHVTFAMLMLMLVSASVARAAENTPQLVLDTGGHMARIKSVAFTPDGKFLVSAGDDKVIRVWDWGAGITVRTIRGEVRPGNEGQIFAMALSGDGRWLAVGGWMSIPGQPGHYIRLYEFASGKLVTLLKGHGNVVASLAFSPDGKRLISGSSDTAAIIWDVGSGQPLQRLSGHTAGIVVGFTPDGERAVTGSADKTLRLWRVSDGTEIAVLSGHKDMVRALAVSPTDGSIASGSSDGEIRLWNGTNGQLFKTLANQGGNVGSLSFSPDGMLLVSSCASYCKGGYAQQVWDVATGGQRAMYTKHDNTTVSATAVSPDGNLAASGDSPGQVHIWEVRTARAVKVLVGSGARMPSAGFSPDGRRMTWGNSFKAAWKANDWGEPSFQLRLPTPDQGLGRPAPLSTREANDVIRPQVSYGSWSLAHGPGGNYGYANASLEIRKDGKVEQRITLDATNGLAHNSYSFTPDGQAIVSGGGNGSLISYDLKGNPLGKFIGHEGDVWAATPSPDGRYLVSGNSDQTVRLWNLTTRELITTLFHGTDGEWVMWTPQGYYTSSPDGDKLVGWQINRGPDKTAEYYTARQLKQHFYRPDIVERAIILASAAEAVAQAKKADPERMRFDLNGLLNRKPPAISIAFPADGTRITAATADVVIDIGETTDPVTRVEAFVNGAQVTPADMRGLIPVGISSHSRKITVPVNQGENRIAVRATNAIGVTERELTLFGAAPGALDKKGKLFIVAIGVDQYPQLPKICTGPGGSCNLNYAGADARAFVDQMVEAAGPLHERVESILLVNGAGGEHEPTASNIVNALRLLKQSGVTDTVVVFFSGHGAKEYLFLPTDARRDQQGWVASNVFDWALLEKAFGDARGRRMLFVDTCHAANSYNGQIVKNAHDDNIAVFAAVDANSVAQERDDLGHGVFTYVVLRALKGEAAQGKEVRLFDFASFVDRNVRKLTNEAQQPEYNIQHAKNYIMTRVR